MYAVTDPAPEAMLTRTPRQGTVKAADFVVDSEDSPVTANHVAVDGLNPALVGSSKQYSTEYVAVPDTTTPMPTLKGFKKKSNARTALEPVPVCVSVITCIYLPFFERAAAALSTKFG